MKSKRILSVVAIILLAACAPLPAGDGLGTASTPLAAAAPPTVQPSETPLPTPIPPTATVTPVPPPLAERVLIISFDGLRPDAIGKAPMKNLIALMEASAWTLSAQTIFPSSALPSHASMLGGVCPDKHGVYWNSYVPENGYALGAGLFDIAHAAGLRTVMVAGKEKMRQIAEPSSLDSFIFKETDLSVANMAIAEIRQGFGVMFVHFPEADVLGHDWNWMGLVQMSAYRKQDAHIAAILAALDQYGLRDGTLVIFTADHGGIGHSHGGNSPEELTIPWIVTGPGVIPGPLASFVQTTDSAATAAYALGLPLPADWDGVPVYEAFGLPAPPRIHEACQYTK